MKKPRSFYLKKHLLMLITAMCTFATGFGTVIISYGIFVVLKPFDGRHHEGMGADGERELHKYVSFLLTFLKNLTEILFMLILL